MEKVLADMNIFKFFNLKLQMNIHLHLLEDRYEEQILLDSSNDKINLYYTILKDDIKRADWIFKYLDFKCSIPDDVIMSLFDITHEPDKLNYLYQETYKNLVTFFDINQDYENAYIELYKFKRIYNIQRQFKYILE